MDKTRNLSYFYEKNVYKNIRKIYSIIKQRTIYLIDMLGYKIKLRNINFILIDTPTHGNLGDHAIVLAEQQFLEERGEKYIELTACQINSMEKQYAKIIPKDKIILLPGGGFLGELWKEEEYRVRRILKAFSEHKIVIFPQTLTFEANSIESQEFFKESKEIYSLHQNLTLFVREKKSFDFVKEKLPGVSCFMAPDMVLGLKNLIISLKERKDILLCMRSDCEKKYSERDISEIIEILRKKYPNEKLRKTDTVIKKNITPKHRKGTVEKKLLEFVESKLVVTDRLHGMIFAVITGTPCIAINNGNGKVGQVYQWIKNVKYVYFVDDIQQIEAVMNKLDLNVRYEYREKMPYEKIKEILIELKENP